MQISVELLATNVLLVRHIDRSERARRAQQADHNGRLEPLFFVNLVRGRPWAHMPACWALPLSVGMAEIPGIAGRFCNTPDAHQPQERRGHLRFHGYLPRGEIGFHRGSQTIRELWTRAAVPQSLVCESLNLCASESFTIGGYLLDAALKKVVRNRFESMLD